MKKNRTLTTVILTIIIFASSISSVIYAWSDNSQHKTSVFNSTSPLTNITLVEDFRSPQNWKNGETVIKKIFVRNGNNTDLESSFTYQPMFVRIQLREFLGYEKNETVITEYMYYQNNDNEFYKFDTAQQASEFAMSLELSNPSTRIDKLRSIKDEKTRFYIRVLEEDENSLNFNNLVVLNGTSDLVSLETGNSVNKIESSEDKHSNIGLNGQNLEDSILYKTHLWESGKLSLTPEDDIFSEYVTWNLGEDVISFEDWQKNYQSKPVSKWIVDTNPFGEGWVYWGQPLLHSSSGNSKSITSNFMESVTLKERMDGVMEYRIHINLDAVTFEDINLWSNAPQAIKESLMSSNGI